VAGASSPLNQAQGAVGYTGTPLVRKLGVKGHQCLLIHGAPKGWTVADLPEGVLVVSKAERADVVVAFFSSALELASEVERLGQAIVPDGSLWLAWPRRAGGRTSDITDNVVRQIVLPLGLVDVKVAALDQDWSGLKFMWRKELRPGLEHRARP
jgi:hypothetical protein